MMVMTILTMRILMVTSMMSTLALMMMMMKSLKVPGRGDEHSQKDQRVLSRRLSFPRTVPNFMGQCQVLRLAEFGKPEWHVVLMEFNDQLLLGFMQVI